MAAGHGGQILVADSTAGLLGGIDLLDLGPRRLRDVPIPVGVFQLRSAGLRVDFPPLRGVASNPGNLRPAMTNLIGRDTEVSDIQAAVRSDWRNDMRSAIAMQRSVDAHGMVMLSLITTAYALGISTGAMLADDDAVRESAEAVRIAEECGDDVALEFAHIAHGLVLSRRATAAERDLALELLREARDAQERRRNFATATMADIRIAELKAQRGEVRGAIKGARCLVDQVFENGEMLLRGVATAAFVESLLRR